MDKKRASIKRPQIKDELNQCCIIGSVVLATTLLLSEKNSSNSLGKSIPNQLCKFYMAL